MNQQPGTTRTATIAPRRIAVVPAYNEEPTVKGVLERLYPLVDELVVVDDGSTDNTREVIEKWLPEHDDAWMLSFDDNQGMSAAYYLAFTDLRQRLATGEIGDDDLVYTVDADGQHELSVLDDLRDIAVAEGLDALIVQRDLSTYPIYKRVGNWVMSAWASLWAGPPAPRRRVRVPDLPRRLRSPTPSTTTRATSTARPSRSPSCCAGSDTASATTSSSRSRVPLAYAARRRRHRSRDDPCRRVSGVTSPPSPRSPLTLLRQQWSP